MIFHFTEKLSKKLKTGALTKKDVQVADHLRWYATLFRAERCQYILSTNAVSLFSVVFPGQGLTRDDMYLEQFIDCLRDMLKAVGREPVYDRYFAPHTSQIILSKTANRSVLGSMNEMIYQCKVALEYNKISPYDLSAELNKTLFSAIQYLHPQAAFLRLFEQNQ